MEESKLTLKEKFVRQLLDDILAGRYQIGEKLPSERELSEQIGISRTVVRAGLAELEADGVIEVLDRRGSVVVDYIHNGRISILEALMTRPGALSRELYDGFIDAGLLLQLETARLAAKKRTNENLYRLFTIIQQEHDTDPGDAETLIDLGFKFHKAVTSASGNSFYPIIFNSMEVTYKSLLRRYYRMVPKIEEVIAMQEAFYDAVWRRDSAAAEQAMFKLINHRA